MRDSAVLGVTDVRSLHFSLLLENQELTDHGGQANEDHEPASKSKNGHLFLNTSFGIGKAFVANHD